uniref:Motility protein n=1 Tax=Globodera pallida TaxID=36090 RepID=A0A183CF07_GLOPA
MLGSSAVYESNYAFQIVSLNAADPSLQNLNHLSPEIVKVIQYLIAKQSSNAQSSGSATKEVSPLLN